jgi:AcrR family transcriptional regulator
MQVSSWFHRQPSAIQAPMNVGVTKARGHTRQIAQLAGVGENTLFRQFDYKDEIFWSTLRYHSSRLKLRRELVEEFAQNEPPEVVLPKLLNLLSGML